MERYEVCAGKPPTAVPCGALPLCYAPWFGAVLLWLCVTRLLPNCMLHGICEKKVTTPNDMFGISSEFFGQWGDRYLACLSSDYLPNQIHFIYIAQGIHTYRTYPRTLYQVDA